MIPAGIEVSTTEVSRSFATGAGVVRAVDGIDLVVPAGSGLAITGESGCGKSTLLSMIGALEVPDQGTVVVGGQLVSDMPEGQRAVLRRQSIGFVFQSHNLQPFLTAMENVSMQLSLAGGEQSSGRAGELLASLGLEGAGGNYPDQLSGGERQRVAVARALVHRPALILADEPTGSLDVDNSEVVIDLLLKAQAESGATLILITHDPAVASRLQRRVVLSDGRLVADDAASATTAQPGSSRV
ncbi:MAG: ABC transporter ATP-binding protein [Solirubrobacterales bacterium]|nr:ABC transporter ATP-binding protein [Solirubrobacterales bacterium]